jgi:aerobic C4-dicarboxylate transport protein
VHHGVGRNGRDYRDYWLDLVDEAGILAISIEFPEALSIGDLLLVLAISLVTSKGAHGVPGSAIVILAATLNAVPSIPAIGLVLVLSVDWFIGMVRALGNLIGNRVATVVVAAWEKDLNLPLAERVLDSDVVVEARAA